MKHTVLLIDPSEPLHHSAEGRLIAEAIELHRASDGARGLYLAAALRPDLILLDVDTPAFDGVEVSRRLKADPRTELIPVVFVAAAGKTGNTLYGPAAGGADCIVKPFDPSELRARVSAAIEKRQADELEAGRASGPAGTASPAYFTHRARAELRAARLGGQPPACLAVKIVGTDPDVTGLHPIHAAGLVGDFSRFLMEVFRPQDIVCHQGGGTFTVLSPGANAIAARRFADRLSWEILDRPWKVAGRNVDLECGVGVAHMNTSEDQDLTQRALDAADEAVATNEPLSIDEPRGIAA